MADQPTDVLNEQFVYIYRDKAGNPLYVGRGRQVSRSQSHVGDHAHNDDLTKALKAHPEHTVEIGGPFGSSVISALVESAVMSAFKRTPILAGLLTNKVSGQSNGSFKPLGVPSDFAARRSLAPLGREELHAKTGQRPALFVLLREKTLADGRLGVDMANPRGIADTRERMIKWWQLRKFMQTWQDQPLLIPCILIGVAGSLKQRIVVGSLAIDDDPALLPWTSNGADSAVRQVPVKDNDTLDFCELRGRRVDPEIVKFGQGPSEHFRIL